MTSNMGLVGNTNGSWERRSTSETLNEFICKKGLWLSAMNGFLITKTQTFTLLLGITNDQCSVDAEYFTSEKSCQNSSSSGFDKEIISEDLPMIDVFLNKDKRKDLLLMEEVMRLVHSTQQLKCKIIINVIFFKKEM